MPSRPPVHGAVRRQREYRERADLVERARPSAAARGYNTRWSKAAKGYLAKHPLCAECERGHCISLATEVDHIVPHRLTEALESGNEERIKHARWLFWDADRNWQGLCRTCHARKTAAEDGGFGNRSARCE